MGCDVFHPSDLDMLATRSVLPCAIFVASHPSMEKLVLTPSCLLCDYCRRYDRPRLAVGDQTLVNVSVPVAVDVRIQIFTHPQPKNTDGV
jgi:hypothetical protein